MTARTLDTPHDPKAGPTETKKYLDVKFKHKDIAKQYGARWDGSVKRWYYPRGSQLETIFSWRIGLSGIGGCEHLRISSEADLSLADELGVGRRGTSSQYTMNYTYHVQPRTRLHLIYSWRKPNTGKKPSAIRQQRDAELLAANLKCREEKEKKQREHRDEIHTDIMKGFVKYGLTEMGARAARDAVVGQTIPHISVDYDNTA